MPQAVKLPVFKSVLLEKMPELLGRCLRVHDLTVPLGEYPVISHPFIPEALFFALVMRLEHLYELYAVPVYRYCPDLVVLRRLDRDRLVFELDRRP